MDHREIYLYHLKKLQGMLEHDYNEIAKGLQEDFLFQYRNLLEKEKEEINNTINKAKYY